MADVITHRGSMEAIVIDIQECQRRREVEERAEEAWLNRLADKAEAEGPDGSISLEEMAARLRAREA